MRFVMALVGGIIGGVIGAAVWAGISYSTNHEIGWIAWGVGFVVGAGVRLGAQDWDGAVPGMLAVVLAVLAVLGGKYASASLLVSKFDVAANLTITNEDMKEGLCYSIIEERTAQRKPVKWPPGKNLENATTLADFPADVQQEATKKWDAFSPAEQQQQIAERKTQMEAARKMIRGVMHSAAFQSSFGPMDILFFLLAAYTAFRLGSGAAAEED